MLLIASSLGIGVVWCGIVKIFDFKKQIVKQFKEACKRDINFMWLIQGNNAQDYNTIARFGTGRLSECIEDLFNQLVVMVSEICGFKFIFIHC